MTETAHFSETLAQFYQTTLSQTKTECSSSQVLMYFLCSNLAIRRIHFLPLQSSKFCSSSLTTSAAEIATFSASIIVWLNKWHWWHIEYIFPPELWNNFLVTVNLVPSPFKNNYFCGKKNKISSISMLEKLLLLNTDRITIRLPVCNMQCVLYLCTSTTKISTWTGRRPAVCVHKCIFYVQHKPCPKFTRKIFFPVDCIYGFYSAKVCVSYQHIFL